MIRILIKCILKVITLQTIFSIWAQVHEITMKKSNFCFSFHIYFFNKIIFDGILQLVGNICIMKRELVRSRRC